MPKRQTGSAVQCPHCGVMPPAQKQTTIPLSFRLDHTCAEGGGSVHFKASTADAVNHHWNNWCRRQKPSG